MWTSASCKHIPGAVPHYLEPGIYGEFSVGIMLLLVVMYLLPKLNLCHLRTLDPEEMKAESLSTLTRIMPELGSVTPQAGARSLSRLLHSPLIELELVEMASRLAQHTRDWGTVMQEGSDLAPTAEPRGDQSQVHSGVIGGRVAKLVEIVSVYSGAGCSCLQRKTSDVSANEIKQGWEGCCR